MGQTWFLRSKGSDERYYLRETIWLISNCNHLLYTVCVIIGTDDVPPMWSRDHSRDLRNIQCMCESPQCESTQPLSWDRFVKTPVWNFGEISERWGVLDVLFQPRHKQCSWNYCMFPLNPILFGFTPSSVVCWAPPPICLTSSSPCLSHSPSFSLCFFSHSACLVAWRLASFVFLRAT